MLRTSQLVATNLHHATYSTENTRSDIIKFSMCVSSESPYSIGGRTKLRFSLHRNAERHMLYVEAELVSKQDRILCSRLRLSFAQRRLSFFILIRL